MNIIDSIANAPPFFIVLAVVGSGFGLFTGFYNLRRARLIEDIPTARIRSAHQGYVELVGHAVMMDGEPIVAPLSQTLCCWFDYRIEQHLQKSWRTVERGRSDGLFILRDETGDCVIDPDHAEVNTVHSESWSGDRFSRSMPGMHMRFDSLGLSADLAMGAFSSVAKNVSFGSGDYRYTERVLLAKDPLYAIGQFHSLDGSDLAQSRQQLMTEILREWKKSPETLRERFDHNRDGSIDAEEWEDARSAAKKQSSEELADEMLHTHVHMLSKPKGKHFLISNTDQSAMVRKHKRHSMYGFIAFFLAGAVATLMISTQLLA